jgi:hypothetical protein
MKTFYDVRNLPGLKKKPSTSELLDWLKLLVAEDIPLEALQSKDDKVSGAAAGGRAAEERTGRDAVREARLHATPQPLSPAMTWLNPVTFSQDAHAYAWSHCRTSTPRGCATPRVTANCGNSGTPRFPRPRA